MSLDIHRCRFVDFMSHSITALAFTQGKSEEDVRVAVGRSNGDIEVWNPQWGWVHELTLYGGKGRSVEGLVWAEQEDGPRLFSIGGSTSITEWDLESCLPVANYQCDAGVIWSLAASPDGTRLAAGCDNGSVVILNVSGGKGIIEFGRILQRQDARVLSIAWRGNDQVVGGLADARIRVWSTKNENHGKILGTMKVDQSKEQEPTLVWSVKVLNHKLLVSGDSTGSVKFWDLSRFSLLQSFAVHEADVLCLAADSTGKNVFSAGVDRKIINYKLVNKRLGRWASVSNRTIHSHDIRAMAIHESKRESFLVSGGVERSLVVNPIDQFADGAYRKIPITVQQPPLAAIKSSRLLMFYTEQTLKIWKIGATAKSSLETSSDLVENKKLVSRMTLNIDENITCAQLSSDGELLVVSTVAETKVFNLKPSESGKALTVVKVPAHDLEEQGARMLRIIEQSNGNKKLLLVSPESDLLIYSFTRNEEGQTILDIESEPIELDFAPSKSKTKTHLNHLQSVHLAEVSDDGSRLAIARLSGSVDLFDISQSSTSNTSQLLGKFSTPATVLKFSPRNTIVVVTAEVKVLEYELSTYGLSSWSRQNSEILPRQLVDMKDNCCGVFYDPESSQRLWLWGGSWLGFLDTSVNIAIPRIPKRKHDDEQAEIISRVEAARQKDQEAQDESTLGRRAFWITTQYKPILLADSFGTDEIIVVERPLNTIPLPPAFWSNHKINV